MWYAKMYFSEKKECFQYDPAGIQGAPATCRELPFLESLLSFLELDCGEMRDNTLSPTDRRELEPAHHRG